MNDPQFSSLGFAPGTVRGTRAFRVTNSGQLTGVFYDHTWTVGVNKAACRYGENAGVAWVGLAMRKATQMGRPIPYFVADVREKLAEKREPHGLDTCQHGFYGYYDGSNDYYKAGMVMGVIEGWGETVIGTRGFRCMRARIVGLHVPADVVAPVGAVYAGVPFFESFEGLVAAYPPDNGEWGAS